MHRNGELSELSIWIFETEESQYAKDSQSGTNSEASYRSNNDGSEKEYTTRPRSNPSALTMHPNDQSYQSRMFNHNRNEASALAYTETETMRNNGIN